MRQPGGDTSILPEPRNRPRGPAPADRGGGRDRHRYRADHRLACAAQL